MTGRGGSHLDEVRRKQDSFFVSLTVPNVASALDILPRVAVGSDAVELRVDLLEDQDPEAVASQLSLLRAAVARPIVFTVRTVSQGGRFPDGESEHALQLYRMALRMGVEYLDLEMSMRDEVVQAVTDEVRARAASGAATRIIASHHDPAGRLSWKGGAWMPWYSKALQYGHIIKLVGVAREMTDNFALASFQARMRAAHDTPLIALNMGAAGKLSRVLNRFLTPVSHPDLPTAAAPGQLSAADIRRALALLGELEPRSFYLFGKPIAASRSPALHNTVFDQSGLPHRYSLFETADAPDVRDLIRSPSFGGASVTVPLKLDIMPLLDQVSESAKIIGAVNTIVPIRQAVEGSSSEKVILLGDNTDWKGMVHALRPSSSGDGGLPKTGTSSGRNSAGAALVVGTGGTSRAAIFALHAMGHAPIYLVARSDDGAQSLIKSFSAEYDMRRLRTADDVAHLPDALLPGTAISTVPADKAIDASVREVLVAVLRRQHTGAADAPAPVAAGGREHQDCNGDSGHSGHAERVLLEMAYTPRHTPLMQLAEDAGWRTIPGLEVLAAQGWYQFQAWTGITPLYGDARAAVMGSEA